MYIYIFKFNSMVCWWLMLVVNIGAYYESPTKSIAFLGICLEMSSTNLKHQVIEICNTNSMLICTIVSKHHSFYLNFVIKAVAWTVFPELDTLALYRHRKLPILRFVDIN